MQNLQEFYYQKIYFATPPKDRFQPVIIIDDVIVVNFDCLYDRECSIQGTDQLLYVLHQQGFGYRFLFISEDGANINLSGAQKIIENIRDCFHLNENTCAVICREDLKIDNVCVVNNSSVPYWCRVTSRHLQDISIPIGKFNKKFAVWFHRGTFYRLELAKYLYEHYKDSSFISYQEKGILLNKNLSKYFSDVDWANNHTPIIYDQVFPNRVFDFKLILGAERKQYDRYFLEIIAETDILSSDWITEKTIKNLYIGKPFLLFGGAGSLQKLHSFGFKTFSPWIDESYDKESNIYLRLQAIKSEIDRLGAMSLDHLEKLQLEMMPIFTHNRKIHEDLASR